MSSDLWDVAKGVFKGIAMGMEKVKNSPKDTDAEALGGASMAFSFLFNEEFKQWCEAALGERLHPGIQKALQEVDAKPTPENAKKVEKVVQDILDNLAPENFEYSGFKIHNPGHISDLRVRKLLDGVDYLRSLFKKKGMEKLLDKGVNTIVLNIDDPSNAHGMYYSASKTIHLTPRALSSGGPRLWKDWIQEVFLHEFGHYVHMNYLSSDAKAEWDSAWGPIRQIQKEREEPLEVSLKDRERFFTLIQNSKWKPSVAVKKLRGLDKLKMAYWLREPELGVALITPKSFRLTKEGEGVFGLLADPKGYLEKKNGEPPGDNYLQRRLNIAKLKLNLHTSYVMRINREIAQEYIQEDPTIGDISLQEAFKNLEIPSDYGKTNENEDFAETWVAFMVNPGALSEKAKTRMLRTLALSNLYGKQVLRLANLVTARYIDNRKLAHLVARKFTAAYDPDQTMAELMAGLGMLLVQSTVVTNAFFKEEEVQKYLRIRRAYHEQFTQACSDLADAIESGEFGDLAKSSVNPLRTVATIPATQNLRALRMVARAFRGLKQFRNQTDLFSPNLIRLIRVSEILVRQVANELDYSTRERLYEDYLSRLVRLPELPAPMKTLFRKAIKYGRNIKPDENANPGAWFELSSDVKDRIRGILIRTESQIKEVSDHYSEDPEANRVKLQKLQDKLEKIQGAAGVNTAIIIKEEREPLDKILKKESNLSTDGPTKYILDKVVQFVRSIGLRDPRGKDLKNIPREIRKVLTLLGKAKTFPTVRRIILEATEQKVLPLYVSEEMETYLQQASKNRAIREGKKILPLTWKPTTTEEFQSIHDTGTVSFGPEFPESEREEALGKVSRALSDLEGIFGKGFCGKHKKKLQFDFGGAQAFAAASYFTWDNPNDWQPRVKFGEEYEGLLAHELSHYFEDMLSWKLSGDSPSTPAQTTIYGVPAGGGIIFGNTGVPLERLGKEGVLKGFRERLSKHVPEFLEFVDAVLSTEDYQRWCDKIGRLEDAIPGAIQELTGMSVYDLPKDHPYTNALNARYKSDLPPELIEAAEKKFAEIMGGDTRKLSYYQSTTEIWARMCEQYVYNKLMQVGIANPWLTQLTYDIDVMDQFMDEETFDQKMMPVMDKIFSKLGAYNIIEKKARLVDQVLSSLS